MNATPLEFPLYRAAQVREFDRRAIEEQGIAGYELMTRAAAAALRELRAYWPRARRIHVICGAGNNAGDGYVLARLAQAAGLDPRIVHLVDPEELRGDARTACLDARAAAVPAVPFTAYACADADVLVDALLGTGLDRPLSDTWAAAVDAINAAAAPVLALDIPSGLQADTGAVQGCAVRADLTVSFIAAKPGLYTGRGPDHTGRIVLATLDVPPAVFAAVEPAAWRIDTDWLQATLPSPRPRCAHKGAFGHVLVIGGQPGMSGAARLAGEAAARVGAGLVSVATHPEHAAALNLGRPELMVHAVADSEGLKPLLERATVLALGPGLGQSAWARGLLAAVWDSALPVVVDADGLNLLAQKPLRRDNWILTPHPGEAARMLGISTAQVQDDRLLAAASLRERFGAVVVLKGNG
ncbi:MAG TPA: NAD(P)H-hydrate dehydratase, partial [Gammaproteobacteria bacterium]